MRNNRVMVIGAGLAGSEAAWQLTRLGIEVDLYEMRPKRMTEAHITSGFAELVCSNSLGSTSPNTASTQLKAELTKLGAFVLSKAFKHQVPAGASLAVDREKFSSEITELLKSDPMIRVFEDEVTEIPSDQAVVIATGPLTTPELSNHLAKLVGEEELYFFDAISPIVSADSLDLSKMYFKSRYDKGEPDYLNIALEKEEYEKFVEELLNADVVIPHNFENIPYFESCLPIEVIASRGIKTLAFGPLKPVGLHTPDGKRPYAVIQLRAENKYKSAYNLVGFQTKLKYGEQLRIFKTLPGLENAEFVRLGSIHRNTYINSPKALNPTLQLKMHPNVFIAGQLTGTEGYLESSATGLVAGRNAANWVLDRPCHEFPEGTMLGGLLNTITEPEKKNFQPTNANMSLIPPLEEKIRDKKLRKEKMCQLAIERMNRWIEENEYISSLQ